MNVGVGFQPKMGWESQLVESWGLQSLRLIRRRGLHRTGHNCSQSNVDTLHFNCKLQDVQMHIWYTMFGQRPQKHSHSNLCLLLDFHCIE